MAILARIVARLSHDSQDATRAACLLWFLMLRRIGGGGGIRTPETLAGLTVFKTAAFNRSATPPRRLFYTLTDSYKTKPRPPVAYYMVTSKLPCRRIAFEKRANENGASTNGAKGARNVEHSLGKRRKN